MDKTIVVKVLVAFVLLVAWVVLAITGKTEVAPVVQFIQLTLTGLAAHTLTMVNPSQPTQSDSVSQPAVQPAVKTEE